MSATMRTTDWQPPDAVSRDDTIARSEEVRARPDIPITATEDIFRIRSLELDWDMGMEVFEPENPTDVAIGADGKKSGSSCFMAGPATANRWRAWPACLPRSSAARPWP